MSSEYEKIVKLVEENPELAGLLASIGGFAVGVGLMVDDAKDFGLLGSEREPPNPHHYLIGLITMLGSLIGICSSGVLLLKKYMNHRGK